MKNRLLVLLCGIAALSLFAGSNSVASVSVGFSIGVFDGPLSACGSWVDRAPYGRCWHPAYVASSWRPYCNGYWMWTDDGWYWVSDEPWAWACYHYGRWVDDPYYGWIWVPDTEWGPSWVAWRSGDDYVGWAPLSPECRFGVGGEFVFRESFIRPAAFVFVDVHHFGEPVSPHTVIVNNTTIINKTVNVTRIRQVNNVVVNNGPNVQTVQRFNQRKLTVAPLQTPRWSGIATPRHPAPEVLQPSAVRPPRETGGRFNARGASSEPIRPRTPGAVESPAVRETPAPRAVTEDNLPRRQRIDNPTPVQAPPSAGYPSYDRQRGGFAGGGRSEPSSQEQKYQNFGPRPYPYGRVQQGAPAERPRSTRAPQRDQSDRSPRGGRGDQQDRGQGN